MIFYRDASSALLQLVNQWLKFTCSRSHAFLYGRQNKNPVLTRIIEHTTSALYSRCAGYLLQNAPWCDLSSRGGHVDFRDYDKGPRGPGTAHAGTPVSDTELSKASLLLSISLLASGCSTTESALMTRATRRTVKLSRRFLDSGPCSSSRDAKEAGMPCQTSL